MSLPKGKYTLKNRKSLNERIMDAYDRGFQDGFETGYQNGIDDGITYVEDMDEIRMEVRP